MQDLDNFRAAVNTAIEATRATFTDYSLAVDYENRHIVNPDALDNPYLCVELKFVDSGQRDLNPIRTQRVLGFVILTVKCKVGAGTSGALKLLEHMYKPLHCRKLGAANMEVAKLVPGREVKGFWCQSIMIPFWLDTQAF